MEIIAEIGQNHNGDMGLAKELIVSAKECGADVAKFQIYSARDLFQKEGNDWFDYNCQTELSRDQIGLLKDECERVGIEFMASVFDVERVAWLEAVGMRRYKIASRSVNDAKLIDAIAKTGQRLIVSLGMWSGEEFPKIGGSGGVDFLYCISKYPTPLSDLHLAKVDFLRYAGFSDHTIGTSAAITALARGARIVEKHFTIDKKMYGPDHAGSMTPDELTAINVFRHDLETCL